VGSGAVAGGCIVGVAGAACATAAASPVEGAGSDFFGCWAAITPGRESDFELNCARAVAGSSFGPQAAEALSTAVASENAIDCRDCMAIVQLHSNGQESRNTALRAA